MLDRFHKVEKMQPFLLSINNLTTKIFALKFLFLHLKEGISSRKVTNFTRKTLVRFFVKMNEQTLKFSPTIKNKRKIFCEKGYRVLLIEYFKANVPIKKPFVLLYTEPRSKKNFCDI